jgi:DNA-binding transcriptional MerR regulator
MSDASDPDDQVRRGKSAEAFRTISEAAAELDVPQHVLRFWETRFPQLKPLKRAGGRRYYRPEDIALLRRVRSLLYSEGYTIRGVQKLLREGKPEAAPASPQPQPTPPPAPKLGAEARAALREIVAELETARAQLRKTIG